MIKYIGSKRTLIEDIFAITEAYPDAKSFLDLFSGTSRVGHAFKKHGYQVFTNDVNAYAHTLATCYVQADQEKVEQEASQLIAEFNQLKPSPGYFTETFCVKSRFFQPHNGERIDAIRERIEALGPDPVLKAVLLVSLMEAADRVDSTTGVQMAYLKEWAARAHNNLELRMPALAPASQNGPCLAIQKEALEAAETLEADIAYLDPPYNQHSYLGNYHIWESLVLWDKPEVYGVACKRIDCRSRHSNFNSRPKFAAHFQAVLRALKAKVIVVSFSNEGFLEQSQLEAMLGELGTVQTVQKDYRRYIGAQIGIHNPQGVKVGEVSHLRNKEILYVCDLSGRPSTVEGLIPVG